MYAIKVIWDDGEEELLCKGITDEPARFATRRKAQEMAEFMKVGMDEVQSVNVVQLRGARRILKGEGVLDER